MKKLSAYLLLLSLIIIFISACGSSDNTPPATSSSSYTYLDAEMRAAAGNQKVTLDWQMYKGAVTYNIYYVAKNTTPTSDEMKAGSKFTLPSGHTTVSAASDSPLDTTNGEITGVISATLEIDDLTNGTQYWFSFAPVDSSGNENNLTVPISATPTNSVPLPLSKPENIRANAGDKKVTVTWDPVAGADHYLLHCYWMEGLNADWGTISIPGDNLQQIVDSTTLNWTYDTANPGVQNDRTYYFWIYAVTSDDITSSASESFTVSATPSADPPPMSPTDLIATNSASGLTSGQIYLDWTAVAGVTYNVYGGTAKGVTKSTTAIATGGTEAGFTVTGLDTTKKYYFVVTAVGTNTKESAESNEVSATPHL
ncbi:MAG: hypothetical protein STSR0002_16030 [Smithella sp.]|jgi:chondroitin AC lyase